MSIQNESNGVKTRSSRPQRYSVLVVSHPDGYVEAFAENNIDVMIERMPVASGIEAEGIAEEVMLSRLPRRYSELYWPKMRRKNGHTRPLLPETIEDADYCRAFIDAINNAAIPATPTQGVAIWI